MIERDPGLAIAEKKADEADKNLVRTREEAIGRCTHEIVFHARLVSDGPNPFGRICPRCSYEEHAWDWPSYSATNNDRNDQFKSILNTELVVECDSQKFYSFRT